MEALERELQEEHDTRVKLAERLVEADMEARRYLFLHDTRTSRFG
jgi:hypothetical protein